MTASEEYFSSGFFGVSGNYLSASSFAKSDPGTVGASARTELFFPDFNQLGRIQKGAQGQASFRIDDLIFSSVEPSDATSVQNVSLNVHVDGSLSANAQKGHGIGSAFAQASVHLSGSLGIPFGTGFISFSGSRAVSDSADDADPFGRFSRAESGLFSGQSDGSFLFTSASADLPLGTPLLLSLELTTGAFSYADQHGTGGGLLHLRIAEAQSSFADTVSFPTSGPVFNLPDGFTVNSASGLIVDNRWVGGTQTSPVPEPSSVALLGTGLLSLAGCGLRRRQSAAQAA